MTEHPNIAMRRLRMLYSFRDLQLALSAADFLTECDEDDRINRIELRRFKSYETTMVIAYARPFSQSKGKVPPLTLKMTGVQLDEKEQALHDLLIEKRNKAVAHSDSDFMRIVVKLHHLDIREGETMPFFETVFDEGIDFLGWDLLKVIDLIRKIIAALHNTLIEDARKNPEAFDLRYDYLSFDEQD